MVTFPSLDTFYAGYSVCSASSQPTPSALFWEADLYELHYPDYLAPGLLEGSSWRPEGKRRKVRAFISLLPCCLV